MISEKIINSCHEQQRCCEPEFQAPACAAHCGDACSELAPPQDADEN